MLADPALVYLFVAMATVGGVAAAGGNNRQSVRPAPMLRRMVDNLAGCSLLHASRQLDEIARFERE